MPDEPILREKAREAIRRGLTTRKPDRTYGGPGSEVPCAVCGQVVKREEMELEIEFNRDSAEAGSNRYYFHPRCFAAWEFERTKVDQTAI